MSMNREQLIRICLNSGVVRRDVAINLIEIIENNIIEEANKRANSSWTLMCEKMVAAEREECAKACDELVNGDNSDDYQNAADWCASRIRARG